MNNNKYIFKPYKQKPKFSFVLPITQEDLEEYKKFGIIRIKEDISENDNYHSGFRVSISDHDKWNNNSPKIGDMIAINPNNYKDQWLIEESYFKDNHITDMEVYGIPEIEIKK